MDFDDVENNLIISEKIQFINPILTVSTIQNLRENFKSSLVLELYWENKIEYKYIKTENNLRKISLLTLFRKFISKKIRTIIN